MRHLLHLAVPAAFALAACLSAPTGKPAGADDGGVDAAPIAWPPTNAAIDAVAAGAVDGDTLDDLVVVDSGSGQVYLLKGGTDVARGAPVRTASKRAAITGLRPPAAALIVPGTPPRILVLDSPADLTRVTFFDADLVWTGESTMSNATLDPTDLVSLSLTGFGMSGATVFILTPTRWGFLESTELGGASPMILMPNTNTGLTEVTDLRAAGGYVEQPMPHVFLVEPTIIQRADVSGPSFAWTTIRDGDTWTGNAVADLTADGKADVVGYMPVAGTPSSSKLCVTDVDAASTACVDTPFQAPTAAVRIGDVTGMRRQDVVLLDPMAPGGANVVVATDLHFNGPTLATGILTQPTSLTGMLPRLELAQLDTGGKEIVVVGRGGAVSCLTWNAGSLAVCPP